MTMIGQGFLFMVLGSLLTMSVRLLGFVFALTNLGKMGKPAAYAAIGYGGLILTGVGSFVVGQFIIPHDEGHVGTIMSMDRALHFIDTIPCLLPDGGDLLRTVPR